MPLRIVRRPGRATLYIRGTVRRQSVFESTGTDRADLAEQYRAKREAELWSREIYGARAVVGFGSAAESYLTAEPRSRGQSVLVGKLITLFGGTLLSKIDQAALDRAYVALLRPGASPATKLRSVLTPLRAIMEHAARRGWCDRPAFEVPKQPQPRVAYLTPQEADRLHDAAAPHLRPLIVFLIGTAARMSEALELDWRDVDLAGSRVVFRRTKNGRERHIDLVPAVRAALAALPHREGRVFRPVYRVRGGWITGEAYRDTGRQGGGQIKRAWSGAVARAALSPELRPHDLRHTAATWNYAVHRDLLRLKAFGGWSGVKQVEIYAHLLPEAYTAQAAAWLGLDAGQEAIRA